MDPDTPEKGNDDTTDNQPTVDEPASTPVDDKDWKAEAEKWKALSRKNENASHEALRELEKLRAERMTDTEKAIAEAEQRGAQTTAERYQRKLAEASFKAAAAGKVADPDAILELVDVSKFITSEGVDEDSIAAAVERFAKAAPSPKKFGLPDGGPKGDQPVQLTEADLQRMSPEQIVEARAKGQLDDLLGLKS